MATEEVTPAPVESTPEDPELVEPAESILTGPVTAEEDPKDVLIRRLQVGLTLASVVIVGLVVAVVLLAFRAPAPVASPTPETSPSQPTPPQTYTFTNYVEVNSNVKPGAMVIEIHDDYQCPWCERAEEIYGDALHALSQSGDIDLRIHIRTLVGDQIIHNDSSERAGIAALCANTVGHFWEYHATIFANQPEEGVGYTDDQLRTDFASLAGITGADLTTFQTCYDTKATSEMLTAMEQEGVAAGINGTPSFFINGQQVSFDLQPNAAVVQPVDPANLLAELQQVFG